MTTNLFWFSGTGNSLAIARDLAAALDNAKLVPMARVSGGQIPAADKIGFIFPVYAFGLPGIVAEFLRKMPVNARSYYFTVANCAGTAGAPHRQARKILHARGGCLAAGWTLFMPSNYPVMTDPFPEPKQQDCFDKMKGRLAGIAEMIRNGQTGSLEESSVPFRWFAPLVNFMAIGQFRKADKKFWVESTCRECGLCAKVCPVDNIKLVDKKPTWLHRCEQCMACLQWCPVQAIQYGQVTKNRKRYHHPQSQAKDFILRETPSG
ncbi:MAG: EFR1 family ferrodoxin [Verrucomicrobia bacterium]|nr:EFR1 family ferrodoxin [Verrucomicrobiota bacterium]MCG2681708.1 EFR1 family ferrodoxin [Kiritimatiellia bacterium]MBU4248523.1 EFR1 family ferrodoxin [Verrucomicrobiota bacterium]MBU4290196.1 EFR1 family ferrodoxin [Verrucomicrobiota bacterium]MBU4428226.1 EFR1 family ferrodoxin [Verrucomicrobiota bacterium]